MGFGGLSLFHCGKRLLEVFTRAQGLSTPLARVEGRRAVSAEGVVFHPKGVYESVAECGN